MTFKTRVALSFGFFVLLVAGQGAGLMVNAYREEAAFRSGRNALRAQFMAQEVEYFVTKKIKAVEAYVLLQEELERIVIEESDAVLAKKFEVWERWVKAGDAAPEDLKRVRAAEGGLKALEAKVMALMDEGRRPQAMAIVGGEYRGLAKTAREAIKEIAAKKVQEAVDAERDMQRVVRQSHVTSIAGVLLAVILGVAIAMSLYNSVMLPMKVIAMWSEQIAKGHLHVSLEIPGNSEMGRLAQNFNGMVQSLSQQHAGQVARVRDEKERAEKDLLREREMQDEIKRRREQLEKEEVHTLEDAVDGFREILDIMAPPSAKDKKKL